MPQRLPSLQLSERAVCDLELLAIGGFSPLDGFMSRDDHEWVVHDMRLANGVLFPIPVTLPIDPATWTSARSRRRAPQREQRAAGHPDRRRGLRVGRRRGRQARLWHQRPAASASRRDAPLGAVQRLRSTPGPAAATHYDFRELRRRPPVRNGSPRAGYPNVVAFQTRNPLHRVHEELTSGRSRRSDGRLLLHPCVGMTQARRRRPLHARAQLMALAEHYYDARRTCSALLPLAMRMAGPREALWHAVIRRNYGANHLIVGRDHASPGSIRTVDPSTGRTRPRSWCSATRRRSAWRRFRSGSSSIYRSWTGTRRPPRPARRAEGAHLRDTGARGVPGCGPPLPSGSPDPRWPRSWPRPIRRATGKGCASGSPDLSGSGKSTTAEALTVLLLERAAR